MVSMHLEEAKRDTVGRMSDMQTSDDEVGSNGSHEQAASKRVVAPVKETYEVRPTRL